MEPQTQQLRQTAYKVWIADLLSSPFQKQAGEWEPNFVQIKNLKVSRVNILATVVLNYNSEDGAYSTLTLDDGSSQIQVKAWREDTNIIKNINVGNTITVIGRVRQYNNEIYITPEIIKILDNPIWIKIRKLELLKLYGKPVQNQSNMAITTPPPSQDIQQHAASENSRQKILNLIEKNSSNEGADITQIIALSKIGEQEAESLIDELIKEGEAYQPKPGRIKIIS